MHERDDLKKSCLFILPPYVNEDPRRVPCGVGEHVASIAESEGHAQALLENKDRGSGADNREFQQAVWANKGRAGGGEKFDTA